MNKWAFLVVVGVLSCSPAFAQEHQHGDKKDEPQAPAKKDVAPAKAAATCCEGMDKSEMKDEMKAKMEKMKAMKEKMADKMKAKGMEGSNSKDAQDGEKKIEPSKETHAH
jgi:hypothetical protein